MSSIEDILFAPILPPNGEDKLRVIIRRLGMNRSLIDITVTEIVDLLRQYGFTDPDEMGDIVRRVIRELNGG